MSVLRRLSVTWHGRAPCIVRRIASLVVPFAGSAVEVAASHGCGGEGEGVAFPAGDVSGVSPLASGDNPGNGEFGFLVGLQVGLALG